MPTRVAFHEELRVLEDHLLTMSSLVTQALEASIASLLAANGERAREVIAGDDKLNELHLTVTLGTLELIATQQPMASDLREILAISSIATDLERIGDHAKGIARTTLRLEAPVEGAQSVHLATLSETVRSVLSDAIDALVARDPDAARSVARRDDDIDRQYSAIHSEVIRLMVADPESVRPGEGILWAAKSLERAGDHVTNICEWIVFQATGALVELNG